MPEQPRPPKGAGSGASEKSKAKVTTEGSARVLNEVKGRLESIETGDLPVIEKIGPDGTVRRVDPTGEMIRPDAGRLDAARLAAEQFAADHSTHAAPTPGARPAPAPTAPRDATPERKGFWARFVAWFRRA